MMAENTKDLFQEMLDLLYVLDANVSDVLEIQQDQRARLFSQGTALEEILAKTSQFDSTGRTLGIDGLQFAVVSKLCGLILRDEVRENYDRGFFDGIRWVAEEVLGIADVDAVVSERVNEMRKETETYIL